MAERDKVDAVPDDGQDEAQRRGAVRRSLSATRRATMKPVKATGDTALKSAELAGAAARKSVDVTVDAAAAMGGVVRKPVDMSMGTFFPECRVPAFMMPTGPEVDDYLLMFDLDEFLSNLQTGVFTRPKIDLWAASSDHPDTHRLAEELATEFARALSVAIESTVQAGTEIIVERQLEETGALEEVKQELTGKTLRSWSLWGAAAAVGAGGVAIAPVGVLGAVAVAGVMLAVGMKPRTTVFGEFADYLRVRGDRADAEKQLERQVKRMGSEFKRKQKSFERAVGRLKVQVHPRLRTVAASLRGDATPEDSDARGDAGVLPDVDGLLEHPVYRQALGSHKT